MTNSTIGTRIVAAVGGIHRSASGDSLAASRHESFINTHLVGGLIALGCLAVYLAGAAEADAVAAAALLWLTVPAALAVLLARTGRLALAHLLSAAHHAVLVALVAGFTGGIASFVVPWIVVVPIEATLSGSRRVIVVALGLSLATLAVLGGLELTGLLPPSYPLRFDESVLRAAGLLSAGLYSGLLAVAAQELARKSEGAARDGARRYRLMAENATDLISVHDVDGNARFVSLGAERLFGHDPAAVVGGGFLDAVSVGERPAFLKAVMDAGRDGRETAVAYRLSRGGGSPDTVWVETRCRPLNEAGPAGAGAVVAVTRDISESRGREDELRRARDQAEDASRAKSRFLANISHELRTPLNAIIGFSEVLGESLASDRRRAREREFVGLISESGLHLLHVVNDLLDMSKVEAGRYEVVATAVPLSELFATCRDIMGPAATTARVDIAIDLPEPPLRIVADARAIKQIVLNLLSNAVKFSNAGGTVTLAAREVADEVEILVADKGIGIAPEDLPRLGEPFFQSDGGYDRTYEGTGLGLSVVKGLVGLHHGRLDIASRPGGGTTVTVCIPKTCPTAMGGDSSGKPAIEVSAARG